MKNLIINVLFVFGSVGLSLPAVAQEIAAGSTCQLQYAVKASQKSGGAGKKISLKAGSLTINEIKKGWVKVSTKKLTGYLKEDVLKKACLVKSKETAPTVAAAGEKAVPLTDEQQPLQPVEGAFGHTDKIKIAVMDLTATESLPKDLVSSLSGVVAETLEQLGAFKAIASQDVVKLLNYQVSQQQLGCDETTCINEIGGALGADYLVTGSLTQIGNNITVQLQLSNIKQTRVESRTNREYQGAPQGLYDELRGATKVLVRELLGQKSGSLALTVSEEGATIKIDDTVVGTSPLEATTVAGGTHRLTVEKDGFVAYRTDITIQEGQPLSMNALLVPSEDYVKNYQEGAQFVRTLSRIGLIVGGVGIVGAGATWYLAKAKADKLNKKVAAYNLDPNRTSAEREKLNKDERAIATLDVITLGAAAVGVVGLGAGLGLMLLGNDPNRYEMKNSVSPVASGLTWHFDIGLHSVGVVGQF